MIAPAADGKDAILPLLPYLRAYARSLTGDPHAADDLVQDTLLLALQAWDRFTPGTNLKAWLFRILRNRHLTLRGRQARRLEVAVEDLAAYGSVPAVQESHAELRHFKAAFASLAPSHREVLALWAVQGLAYEEIAEVTGAEVGSIKSRMNRARTTLKALVQGERPIGPAGWSPCPAWCSRPPRSRPLGCCRRPGSPTPSAGSPRPRCR